MQTRKGQEIEDESMQIIESEIGSHSYNEMEWPIVRRIIHSTADFDFAGENKLLFHKDAISNGINALKNGCSIVADVNGVIGLMNKQNPKDFGNDLICNISDPSINGISKKSRKDKSTNVYENSGKRDQWRNRGGGKCPYGTFRSNGRCLKKD